MARGPSLNENSYEALWLIFDYIADPLHPLWDINGADCSSLVKWLGVRFY